MGLRFWFINGTRRNAFVTGIYRFDSKSLAIPVTMSTALRLLHKNRLLHRRMAFDKSIVLTDVNGLVHLAEYIREQTL
jgi:hypothetical protein